MIELKRKIDNVILDWHKKTNKKALLINGARQIGKSTCVERFAKENYKYFVNIDFRMRPDLISCFDGIQDTNTIINNLRFKDSNFIFEEKHTLIFFDEIQLCKKALASLKTLVKENKYDFICSGSIITLKIEKKDFYPIGAIQHEIMRPLDFEEFMWALGYKENDINKLYNNYHNSKQIIPDSINQSMFQHMRTYICVGGMPDAVITYLETKDFVKVKKVQENIVLDYRGDITKSKDEKNIQKVSLCFNSLPMQLDRNNKKFNFNLVSKTARADRYDTALEWLWNAGIIHYCHSLDNTTIPLTANIKNDKFKIYMLDTGLLISMYNDISVYEQILTNEMRAKKGGIYENFVANTLISQGYDLMYYHKDRHNSVKKEAEIDFCISNDGCSLLPIEIKSGRAPSNSLKHVLKDNNIKYGIKAGRFNIGFQNKVFTIPVYMLMFLDRDRIKTLIH